jgi:hypothetical protein
VNHPAKSLRTRSWGVDAESRSKEGLSVSGTAEWKCEEFDRLLGGEEPRRYGLGVRVGPKLRRLILRSDAVTPKLNYGTWARNGVSRVETPD